MIEQLRKFITSDKSGEISGARMNQKYFSKNKTMLQFVKDSTSFYSDEEIEFQYRVKLTLLGATSRMTCNSCGREINPNRRYDGYIPQFCSISCAGKNNNGRKIEYAEEQSSAINQKRKETMLIKYGCETNSQRPEVKLILSESQRNRHIHIDYEILNDKEKLVDLYHKFPSTYIADICNCYYGTVTDYLKSYGEEISKHVKVSKEQLMIADIFKSFGVDPIINARILDGKDIDVYSPDHKFGIEYNGFPWHLDKYTSGNKNQKYHVSKVDCAANNGIRLMHVTPSMFYDQRELLTRMIGYALGVGDKAHARKCTIHTIDIEVAREFLEVNHLNGYIGSNIKLGLFNGTELVQVMTFVKSRYDKNSDWEIARSASSKIVIGGVSKLIKHFKNNYMQIGETLITYADRSISEGKSYILAGMEFNHKTDPSYWYTKDKHTLESRLKYQKHKLTELPTFNQSLSEWENMQLAGYDRYWDCGNNVYRLTK